MLRHFASDVDINVDVDVGALFAAHVCVSFFVMFCKLVRHFWNSGASRLDPECGFGTISNGQCSKPPPGDPFGAIFWLLKMFTYMFWSYEFNWDLNVFKLLAYIFL